jgi:hypothetical protein
VYHPPVRPLCALLLLGCGEDGPAAVPTTHLQAIDLGTVSAVPLSDAVEIDVPRSALSLTLMAETDATGVMALELEAPGGKRIVRADDPAASPNLALPSARVAVAQVPIRPQVVLAPGKYFAAVAYDGIQADVHLRAFIKLPDTEAFDVDEAGQVYRLGLLFATPAFAPGDDAVERAIDDAAALLEGAGLRLESVSEDVLDDAGPVTDSGPELDRLLVRSAGLAESTVPVFVVEDALAGVPPAHFPAFTANVPLPPVDGTLRSGIVLSAVALRDSADVVGQILAHEIGHALGLFHTTEMAGVAHDPLDDTAECGAAQDANSDGALSPAECRGHGSENLMFWECCATSSPEISDDQRFVMLRSALVR